MRYHKFILERIFYDVVCIEEEKTCIGIKY